MPAIIRFCIECEACGYQFTSDRRISWPDRVTMSPHLTWRDIPTREELVHEMISATEFVVRKQCETPSLSAEDLEKLVAEEVARQQTHFRFVMDNWFVPITPPRRRCPDCGYVQSWMTKRSPTDASWVDELGCVSHLMGIAGITAGILILGFPWNPWWAKVLVGLGYWSAGAAVWAIPGAVWLEFKHRPKHAHDRSGKSRRRNRHQRFPNFRAKCPSIALLPPA